MPPRKKVVPAAAVAATTEPAPPATEDDGMGIDQYELPKSVSEFYTQLPPFRKRRQSGVANQRASRATL